MKTSLIVIDPETNKRFRISVDLNNYEIEEQREGVCFIDHLYQDKGYIVQMSYEKLHMLVNGFNSIAWN